MTEEITTEQPPEQQPAPPAEAQTTEPPNAENMIPQSRFNEVNEELKALRAAQEKAQREQEEAERKRLEKQNEFKELYEQSQAKVAELEPYQQRINDLTAAAKAANEKRIEALPEAMRTLVPDYDDPFKLAGWLDTNSAVFEQPPTPSLNGGAGNGNRNQQPSNVPTEAEIKEQAARLNVSARHLAQHYGVQLTQG